MFGMNMNNVAVTDGDRVEFEQRRGYHVDYYPVSSLMEYFKKVTDAEADELVEEYKKLYEIKIDESGEEVYWEKVKNAAKAEIALRRVLKDEGATAFTTNFDDLGDADINVADMTNKSRGDYSYALIDVDSPVTEDVVEKLKAIDGVLKVRIIK